jgi:hypothetical protein
MTIAQSKAARRRGNLYRRFNGPGPADAGKAARRAKEKLERERAIRLRMGMKKKG